MAIDKNIAEQIKRAWNHHREGRHTDALAAFDAILKQNPNDIDANYGYGLVQRTLGNNTAAAEAFQKSLQLVEAAASAHRAQQEDGNVKTPEDDRFMMLTRMTEQRLEEVGGHSNEQA